MADITVHLTANFDPPIPQDIQLTLQDFFDEIVRDGVPRIIMMDDDPGSAWDHDLTDRTVLDRTRTLPNGGEITAEGMLDEFRLWDALFRDVYPRFVDVGEKLESVHIAEEAAPRRRPELNQKSLHSSGSQIALTAAEARMHNPRAALDRVEGADGLEGLMQLSDQVPYLLIVSESRKARARAGAPPRDRRDDAPQAVSGALGPAVAALREEFDGLFRLASVDLWLLETRQEFLHLLETLKVKWRSSNAEFLARVGGGGWAPDVVHLPCLVGLSGGTFTLLESWNGDPGRFAPHKIRSMILSFLDEASRQTVHEGVSSLHDPSRFAPHELRVSVNDSSRRSVDRSTPSSTATLFVSHASEDAQAAADIVEEFTGAGIATWLATRDIQVGDNYAAQIYNAVVKSTHLLVLLSPASVASQHVQREVNLALDQGKVILPLVVSPSADFMSTLPAEWKYWLGVVQVIPYSGASDAVATLLRRLEVNR